MKMTEDLMKVVIRIVVVSKWKGDLSTIKLYLQIFASQWNC